MKFIFFCRTNCDMAPFLSSGPICPHCGKLGAPLIDAETKRSIVATSPRGLELCAMMGFKEDELGSYLN